MNSYFLNAISTILRRKGTNAWEMQEYEQILMPEVFAHAALYGTEEHKTELEKRGQAYINFIRTGKDDIDFQKELFIKFMEIVFLATNNKVLGLMGQIQQLLREMRNISEDDGMEDKLLALEEKSVRLMIKAVKSGNSDYAKELVTPIFKVGPGIKKIMKKTALGQTITIPADIFFKEIKFEDID